MDAIKNLLTRNSISKLTEPYPSMDEMKLVYKAALRAPDHAWLRPSEFIEVTGKGLDKLSKIFTDYIKDTNDDLNDLIIQKYKNAPYRAPMIIVLITNIKEHPKVPEIEQIISLGAAAQNILLGIHEIGYSAVWRTGNMAFNPEITKFLGLEENFKIIGYLYVGTPTGKLKKIPKMDIENFVTVWDK